MKITIRISPILRYASAGLDRERGKALFPAFLLQLRRVRQALRVADAEIPDEAPALGNIQIARHSGGIEHRNPAEPQPFGAQREPEERDRRHHRIAAHFRHTARAKAVPLAGLVIAKEGDLDRGFAHPESLRRA